MAGTFAGPGPVRLINGPPVQPGPGAHGLVMVPPNGPTPVVMGPPGPANQALVQPQAGVVYGGKPIETIVPQVEPIYRQENGKPEVTALVTESNGRRIEHIPLAKCRVLYLGSAVPLETAVGLEAVQKPCRERYACADGKSVEGIDAWLIVFSSGIMLQYVGDAATITWWPISTLYVSAAVKCIKGSPSDNEPPVKFVALDSATGKTSSHPPMFASIMRRTKGVKVLECHVFITKSDDGAMALVQSCAHAYGHKEGWTDDPPPLDLFFESSTNLIPGEKNAHDAPPEFYQKPPEQGYFYSSRNDLVRHYNISGDRPMLEPLAGPKGRPPPQGKPLRLPYPQNAGYFADWDASGGQPLAIFPTAGGPVQTRHRRRKKHHHNERRRRDYSSDSDSSDEEYYIARRRPRTPPADYDLDRRHFRPPVERRRYDRGEDLVLYAPRYNGNMPLEYYRDGPPREHREITDHHRQLDRIPRHPNRTGDDVRYLKHGQMAYHPPLPALPHPNLPRTSAEPNRYNFTNRDMHPDILIREADEFRSGRKRTEDFHRYEDGPNFRIETRPINEPGPGPRYNGDIDAGRFGPPTVGREYRYADREYFGAVDDIERGLGYYP